MSRLQPVWAGRAWSNGTSPRSFFPGYSAALVEAAAPPSSPEEPALRRARAAVTSAPTLSNPASLA